MPAQDLAHVEVLEPGLHSLLVDLGRPRSRSLGVPISGAADRFSLALGNAMVGNPPDALALEITLAGPTIRTDASLAAVVFGAPFELFSSTQKLHLGTTFTLSPGEELQIGTTRRGLRAYLCVMGGFQGPSILGSRSALNPLHPGAVLLCSTGSISARFVAHNWLNDLSPLRALAGPQADWFSPDEFFLRAFTISPASNRMGLRLDGTPIHPCDPQRQLVSEPVCPGSVQVTPDGRCIVLGVDGQTIGGYPKIAQVISADLDKLGQLRPGDHISFSSVTHDEAILLQQRRQADLHEWITRLQTSFVSGH